MTHLVLLRHGESLWNAANRFTGWVDVDLSPRGVAEARAAGRAIAASGLDIKTTFTSYLKRAIRTLWLALDEMDRMWLPEAKSWRLNERHYGALQGLNKAEMAAKVGAEQVFIWRRSFDVPPPPLAPDDPGHPAHDARYADVDPALLPACESLKDTTERVLPYWHEEIAPALARGQSALVAAHGNSLRALVKHIEGISDDDIPHLEIPTGVPLVYRFTARLEAERLPDLAVEVDDNPQSG